MNFGLSNGWRLLPLSQSLSLVALHFSLLGKLPFPSLAWVTQSHCWSLYLFILDAYYKHISASLGTIVSIRPDTLMYRSFCHNHILHPWALSHFTLTLNREWKWWLWGKTSKWVKPLLTAYCLLVFNSVWNSIQNK